MKYIFFDESGNLGFDFNKYHTSHYFILAFLIVDEPYVKRVERIVTKMFRTMSAEELGLHDRQLHAHKEDPQIIYRVLDRLNNFPVKIAILRLDKRKYIGATDDKHYIYNEMIKKLLWLTGEKAGTGLSQTRLIISHRESSKSLKKQLLQQLNHFVGKYKIKNFNADIEQPRNRRGLQLADFIAWSTLAKYEYGNGDFYEKFRGKVIIDEEIEKL
jgi:hypothetical protein